MGCSKKVPGVWSEIGTIVASEDQDRMKLTLLSEEGTITASAQRTNGAYQPNVKDLITSRVVEIKKFCISFGLLPLKYKT